MAILGISAHRTTTYHTQGLGLLNSGYVPDPVQTAAMKAAVTGGNIAAEVQNAIETGMGYNLKQYHAYATRRFKKRNVFWSISVKNSSSNLTLGLDQDKLELIIPELKNQTYRMIHDIDYFSYSGSKYFEDMDKLFGLNDFTPVKPDGTNVVITGINPASAFLTSSGSLNNSWVIGVETSSGNPAVILHPDVDETLITTPYYLVAKTEYKPEYSGGIVYWKSDLGEINDGTQLNIFTRTYEPLEQQELGLTKDTSTVTLISRNSDWKDDSKIDTSFVDTEDATENTTEEVIKITEPKETITYTYARYSGSGDTYTVWNELGIIDYNTSHYVWATLTEESHAGVKQYFVDNNITDGTVYASSNDLTTKSLFKFYPYLPIKENSEELLDFSKAEKYIDALKKVQEGEKLDTEPDSPKLDRTQSKATTRLNSDMQTTNTGRIIQRGDVYEKRMKVRTVGDITPTDERHLVQMSKLLTGDYKALAATIHAGKDSDKIYMAAGLPAVTLGSNYDEVNNYTYKFFKRLFLKFGDLSYINFINAVNQLPDNCTFKDILNLPRIELEFGMTNGYFGGGISFNFIRKFQIKGKIRTTERKHRLKEVRRGKLTYLLNLSGSDLKFALRNPSKELVDDKYVKNKADKEFNIGGGSLYSQPIPQGDTAPYTKGYCLEKNPTYDRSMMTFSLYGYTFFCKQLDDDTLDVIAVCGLIGWQRSGHNEGYHQSRLVDGGTVLARASFDLDMFYQRNHKRYVDKTPQEKINVQAVFSSGSKRYKLETNIQHFFIIPLDFKIVSRMNGVDVMRLAERATMMYTWSIFRHRRLRGWVADAIKAIGYIIAAVMLYFDYSGTSSALTLKAVLTMVAKTVLTQLAVKYGLPLLVRMLGIKGIFALIIIIVAAIVAANVTGYFNVNASLPYASQSVVGNTASNISAQMFGKMTTQSFTNMGFNAISKLATAVSDYTKAEISSLNQKMKDSEDKYLTAMQELNDLMETNKERTAPYDVKEVLDYLVQHQRLISSDEFIFQALQSDNTLASYEFLSSFIENKLNINPSQFDSVLSLDFSLSYDRK